MKAIYKYKYGKELQDELGLNMYDFGFRNYDAAIGRWMNIDPLAEKRNNLSPYNYVQNSPLLRIDPNGLTDFTINKKTGEVKQVGEANDQPDRVLKTNSKGQVKYNNKGKAKVAFGNIEQGILKEGMNLKTNDNIIEVGGKGQPSVKGVETFALRLSDYIGKELGGSYVSKDGVDKTTHMVIGEYERNSLTESKSNGFSAFLRSISNPDEVKRYIFTGAFHTHPSTGYKLSDRLVPSDADLSNRDVILKNYPKFSFYILTEPEQYGGEYPNKIPYKTGFEYRLK